MLSFADVINQENFFSSEKNNQVQKLHPFGCDVLPQKMSSRVENRL